VHAGIDVQSAVDAEKLRQRYHDYRERSVRSRGYQERRLRGGRGGAGMRGKPAGRRTAYIR